MSSSHSDSMVGIKLGSIALLIALVLSYSLFVKKKIYDKLSQGNELVLKEMPDFSLPVLGAGKNYTNEQALDNVSVVFVHFWATWCAPCEAELPSFIEFVKQNKEKNVRAVLVGVQDEEEKMKKYLKRYGKLPESFTVVSDKSGTTMSRFGTVKLPETYLFARSGKNLNKYVGPQDWMLPGYARRLNFYISNNELSDKQSETIKVESH